MGFRDTLFQKKQNANEIVTGLLHILTGTCKLKGLVTVGFLYGAGAETLIFVTGRSAFLVPRQKNQSQRCIPRKPRKNRCSGIRC